jgi:hypothetical protein
MKTVLLMLSVGVFAALISDTAHAQFMSGRLTNPGYCKSGRAVPNLAFCKENRQPSAEQQKKSKKR